MGGLVPCLACSEGQEASRGDSAFLCRPRSDCLEINAEPLAEFGKRHSMPMELVGALEHHGIGTQIPWCGADRAADGSQCAEDC